MLPLDYLDDFEHGGLMDVWFRDVPWRFQERAMRVEPKLRIIRNPATLVFVFVLKLNPEDPKRVHPFFSVATLVGWAPVFETPLGEPVEACTRACEGMEASAKVFAEHYGKTPQSVSRQLRLDKDRAETARVNEMLENTAFARNFANEFRAKSLAMSVSDAKGKRLYIQARNELRQERQRRKTRADALRGGQPLILVAR